MRLLRLFTVSYMFLGLLVGRETKSIFVLQDLLENIETENDDFNVGSEANKDIDSFNEDAGGNIILKKEDSGLGEIDKTPSSVQLSHDCRSYIAENVLTHEECAFYSTNSFYQRGRSLIAQCRWDPRYKKNGVCLCPRTELSCYSDNLRNKCYWSGSENVLYDTNDNGGICISNAEKFYYILRDLLLKRGKKDFAVRIIYNSNSALGKLPYGPHGPSLIQPSIRENIRQYRYFGLVPQLFS